MKGFADRMLRRLRVSYAVRGTLALAAFVAISATGWLPPEPCCAIVAAAEQRQIGPPCAESATNRCLICLTFGVVLVAPLGPLVAASDAPRGVVAPFTRVVPGRTTGLLLPGRSPPQPA